MPDPKVVLTKETLEWFETLASGGAITIDPQGRAEFAPDVRKAIEMLHEIVAGGTVQMTVATPGDQALRGQLDAKLQSAMGSVNLPPSSGGAMDPYGP